MCSHVIVQLGHNICYDEGVGVIVEDFTYVCLVVGAKIVSSIPHVVQIIFCHIYSQPH